jgi:hypothetical protein
MMAFVVVVVVAIVYIFGLYLLAAVTDNRAEIKRLRDRLEEIERRK